MNKFMNKLKGYKGHPLALIAFIFVNLAIIFTVSILGFIIIYILVRGIPYINKDIFAWEYTSNNSSMTSSIINTIIMTILSLGISVPLGIFSAIYLVEYAKKGNKLTALVRITAETLSGIPSIVYGLFGYLFFVTTLKWGNSMLSGGFTLAIMVLPVIIRTTEESLLAVPDSYREGSFGLGAGKLRTVFKIILPCAIPGILSGVILSIGRIVGETAALIYTTGTATKVADSLFTSGRTLSVHMYCLSKEGIKTNQGFATAVMLLVLVALINTFSNIVAKRLKK